MSINLEDFRDFLRQFKVCEVRGPLHQSRSTWCYRHPDVEGAVNQSSYRNLRRNTVSPFPLSEDHKMQIIDDLSSKKQDFTNLVAVDKKIVCELLITAFGIVGVCDQIVTTEEVLQLDWLVQCFKSFYTSDVHIDAAEILLKHVIEPETPYHYELAECLLLNCLPFVFLMNNYLESETNQSKYNKYVVIRHLACINYYLGLSHLMKLLNKWTQPDSAEFLRALECSCYVLCHAKFQANDEITLNVQIITIIQQLQLQQALKVAELYIFFLLRNETTRRHVKPLVHYLSRSRHAKLDVRKRLINIIVEVIEDDYMMLLSPDVDLIAVLLQMCRSKMAVISRRGCEALTKIYTLYRCGYDNVTEKSNAVARIPALILSLMSGHRDSVEASLVEMIGSYEIDVKYPDVIQMLRAHQLMQIFSLCRAAGEESSFSDILNGFAKASIHTKDLFMSIINRDMLGCGVHERAIAGLFDDSHKAKQDLAFLRSRHADAVALFESPDLSDPVEMVNIFLNLQDDFLKKNFGYHVIMKTLKGLKTKLFGFYTLLSDDVICIIEDYLKCKANGRFSRIYLSWNFECNVVDIEDLLEILRAVNPSTPSSSQVDEEMTDSSHQ